MTCPLFEAVAEAGYNIQRRIFSDRWGFFSPPLLHPSIRFGEVLGFISICISTVICTVSLILVPIVLRKRPEKVNEPLVKILCWILVAYLPLVIMLWWTRNVYYRRVRSTKLPLPRDHQDEEEASDEKNLGEEGQLESEHQLYYEFEPQHHQAAEDFLAAYQHLEQHIQFYTYQIQLLEQRMMYQTSLAQAAEQHRYVTQHFGQTSQYQSTAGFPKMDSVDKIKQNVGYGTNYGSI
ncbi:putative acetate kinase [Venturia nashicola]|uniref:Putative acetate kinase n=1 Tax=Venturia nashicola TaxID=86259 RepID=A0A4Z1PA30_9PEZI|nr:putative acetate kinase [Venturia nashicola]TLD37643.1 putative acetate kinase [Venturia nashicola]